MPNHTTPIIVVGASGRMGARLCALASADDRFHLAAAVVRDDSPLRGRAIRDVDRGASTFNTAENAAQISDFSRGVIIDFSSDAGAAVAVNLAVRHGAALLVGTTALSPQTHAAMKTAAASIPLLITPNTSIGIAVASSAVRAVARALGDRYHCSIVEAHHAAKKDAPSGTALRLADAAREGGAALRNDQIVAVRGGDVVGEHTVRFAGPGEYIEITHRATSRDVFVRGALHCAHWLAQQSPGMYSMADVFAIAP